MNPLDPNSSFNGPLTPIQYRQNQNTGSEQQRTTVSSGKPTRYIPLVLGAIALLVLPITVWQLNNQQDIRQRASEQSPVQKRALVRVGDDFITDADIDLEYTKQQNATTYTTAPTALRNEILNDIIEKKIIALEAEKRGITVSNSEIEEKTKEIGDRNNGPVNRELVSEMILAEKVASVVSPTIKADILYATNTNASVKSLFETILSNVKEGGNLSQTATPFLERGVIELMPDKSLAERNTLMSKESSNKVFTLEDGELSEIIVDGNTLFIVEVKSKSDGEYESFDAFIKAQKDKNVELLIDN